MTAPPTYCPMPWVHLCTNPIGRLCLCCEDTLESDFPGPRDYRLPHGLEQFWQSPYLKWVRTQMMNGQRLRECFVCEQEEALGLTSKRQHELSRWGVVTEEPSIRYADLKLGNRCNLRCFMCDPNSSSSLANEYRTLGWDENPPFATGQMGVSVQEACASNMDWPDDPAFWSSLEGLLPQLRRLKLTGGEPLLNPRLTHFLETLRSQRSRDLQLQVTTNATRLDDEMLQLLSDLEAEVVVSAEGVGTVNDFIRFPSRWERIEHNVRRLCAAGVRVRINATLSLYSMLYLSPLVEFSHEVTGSRLTLIPVIRPAFLNPAIAPASLKRQAEDRMEQWAETCRVPDSAYYVEQLRRRLEAEQGNRDRFADFVSYTDTLCRNRGLLLENHLPELSDAVARFRAGEWD